MKDPRTDKELLRNIKNGDQVAFYNIYERYCKKLYGFVLSYIKIEADAEEIVQEVFVKIWENRNKLVAYSSFDSFLFTIAYNATISLLRKRINSKKFLEHLHKLNHIRNAPDLVDELEYKELHDKLKVLLDELTPRQREIFKLSREEGLSQDEIAKKLDISLNTVKKHMVNTLAILRANFKDNSLKCVFFVFFFIL
ncbi:RNA polymerase sigma-70 factor [Maribellus comscasis]|uniref:RNA polymerase sigma factor n=1 Tax=Maribellus comscasis TaxID=2681766 RepID=A0A6I6K145_9BACT|nr:RNA polymerase sigma-70 factor [Maribellus comscasis]QGY47170.1 RNA polymerase sigma-70 factor [Maribellus comscasis]